MELSVLREIKSANSTISEFLINGEHFSYGLEPADRGLTSDMPLTEILAKKIMHRTAIPTGRYPVLPYYSPKHQTMVPLIQDVPGFEGEEIHVGNDAKDTDGCLLLGKTMTTDAVLESRDAVSEFYKIFFAATDKREKVWITFKDR